MDERRRPLDQKGPPVGITRNLTIAAAAGAVCLAGLALPPAASAATDTVIIDCQGKAVTKPKEIVVTCADAGVTVTRITWTSWTMNGANGTGTLAWNTCLPKTCVDGIVQKYKVKVHLGRVASAPSINAFTRMTLAFPKGGPAAAETATFTLDNAQR
jgi:hypothetical protein